MKNQEFDLDNIENAKEFLISVKHDCESYKIAKPQINSIIRNKQLLNKEIMSILCNLFYYCTPKIGIEETLKQLNTIFLTAEFSSNYSEFFDGFNCELIKSIDDQTAIWNIMKECLLFGDKNNFFFGVWIFDRLFDTEYFCDKYTPNEIDSEGLKLLLQGIMYYTFDPVIKCSFALKATNLIPENTPKHNSYFIFCVNDLYDNYKYTLYETSTAFSNIQKEHTKFLIDEIIKKHTNFLMLQEKAFSVPDLYPSFERKYEFLKARYRYNQKINEMVKKQSIFFQLVSNETLKYGDKIAYIRKDSDGKMKYEITKTQKISHNTETPRLILSDPMNFYFSKSEFFLEREKYRAINN